MNKNLVLLTFLLVTLGSYAQFGKLRVTLEDYYVDSDCMQLSISKGVDTLYAQIITNEDLDLDNQFVIDSLYPGMNLVSLVNCGDITDEHCHTASAFVEIKESQVASISFYMTQEVRYTDLDSMTQQEIILARGELQAEYSYFDFRWNPDGNNPKFNFGIAGTGYTWLSFSKHLGFLLGGGFGWNLAQLQIDQQNQAAYPDKIKSNYYNYFYANYDMKFRLSLFNQQEAEVKAGNVFLDLGAQYNLPLYFAHVTRFSIQEKLVNRFIHRFSDVRLYANFGISNFQVFASYRPFDFIKEELPQFPKYNLGVKFNFDY